MARLFRTFNGRNGAGAISVSGVRAGDHIIEQTFENGGSGNLSPIVLVDDEVLQIVGGDLTPYTLRILVDRDAMIP